MSLERLLEVCGRRIAGNYGGTQVGLEGECTPKPGIVLAADARQRRAEGEQRRPGLWRDECGRGRDRAQPMERIVEWVDSEFVGNGIFGGEAVGVLPAAEAGLRVVDFPMTADPSELGPPGVHRRLPR